MGRGSFEFTRDEAQRAYTIVQEKGRVYASIEGALICFTANTGEWMGPNEVANITSMNEREIRELWPASPVTVQDILDACAGMAATGRARIDTDPRGGWRYALRPAGSDDELMERLNMMSMEIETAEPQMHRFTEAVKAGQGVLGSARGNAARLYRELTMLTPPVMNRFWQWICQGAIGLQGDSNLIRKMLDAVVFRPSLNHMARDPFKLSERMLLEVEEEFLRQISDGIGCMAIWNACCVRAFSAHRANAAGDKELTMVGWACSQALREAGPSRIQRMGLVRYRAANIGGTTVMLYEKGKK